MAEHAQGRARAPAARPTRAPGRRRSCSGSSAAAPVGVHGDDPTTSRSALAETRRQGNPPRARRNQSARGTATAQRKTHARRARPSPTYITERFDEFSRSQKDVARYIVDHLDEAAFQTAEELARRANTSSSTVVRFSQALGFDGYPELQQAAIEEYRHKVAEGSRTATAAAARPPSSTSTTPSSRPRWPPTTRTSRRRRATSPASRSRPASRRSPARTRVMIVGVDQMAFFASYLRHLLALLDIRAEVVASPRQDSITQALADGRGHARDRLLRRPRPPARRPRDEAGPPPPRPDASSISDATLSDVGEHAS